MSNTERTISLAEMDGRIIRYNPAWLRRCGWEYTPQGYWLKRGVAAHGWLLAHLLEEQDQRMAARNQETEPGAMKLAPEVPPRVNMVIWRRQSWQAVPRRDEIWQAGCGPYSAEGRTAGEAADRLMPTVLAWMERELADARLRVTGFVMDLSGAEPRLLPASLVQEITKPCCPKCGGPVHEEDHGRGRMTISCLAIKCGWEGYST